MVKMSYVKRSIITAVCIGLCVVLPMAFHAIPNGGTLFSPMHIPVLLAGLICGWPFGLLCGLAGPVLSTLLTGDAAPGYLPPMMIELAAYGLFCGLLFDLVRTENLYADLYISLAAGAPRRAGRGRGRQELCFPPPEVTPGPPGPPVTLWGPGPRSSSNWSSCRRLSSP